MSCRVTAKARAAVVKMRFVVVQYGFTQGRNAPLKGSQMGPQEQRDNPKKRWKTVRPAVAIYLDELPN